MGNAIADSQKRMMQENMDRQQKQMALMATASARDNLLYVGGIWSTLATGGILSTLKNGKFPKPLLIPLFGILPVIGFLQWDLGYGSRMQRVRENYWRIVNESDSKWFKSQENDLKLKQEILKELKEKK